MTRDVARFGIGVPERQVQASRGSPHLGRLEAADQLHMALSQPQSQILLLRALNRGTLNQEAIVKAVSRRQGRTVSDLCRETCRQVWRHRATITQRSLCT